MPEQPCKRLFPEKTRAGRNGRFEELGSLSIQMKAWIGVSRRAFSVTPRPPSPGLFTSLPTRLLQGRGCVKQEVGCVGCVLRVICSLRAKVCHKKW